MEEKEDAKIQKRKIPTGAALHTDRFLNRSGDMYPYGIPKEIFLRQQEAIRAKSARRNKVAFLIALEGSQLEKSRKELLDSIITKGLGLTEQDVEIILCDLTVHGVTLSEWVANTLSSQCEASYLGIVMGFQQQPHGTWSEQQIPCLHTVSLTEVHSSIESKRLFWGHLKAVLQHIKGR